MNHSGLTRNVSLTVAVLLGGYLLVTSTTTLSETLWQYDVKRILELCLLPLIFTAVLISGPLRSGFQTQIMHISAWMTAALSLLLVLGTLSSIHNSHTAMSLMYSLSEVSILALLTLAALCIAVCRRAAGPVFDQTAAVLLALVALAVGIQELVGVLAAWSSGVEFHPRIALLHFSWPRFYNQLQTWSIPIIAALPLIFPAKPSARFLCIAALALEWYVVMATGGRGTMVAVSLAILVSIILLPRHRKAMTVYHLAGFVCGLLILALVVLGHRNIQNTGLAVTATQSHPAGAEKTAADKPASAAAIRAIGDSGDHFLEPLTGRRLKTSSGRLPMWRDALLDARSQPLLGIGPMNFACTGPINRAAHPHNFPLQFAAEWGVPATVLLLFIVVFLWRKLLIALQTPVDSQSGGPPLTDFLAGSMLAASIHACLSGVLVMPASQVTGILAAGWLLGTFPLSAREERNPGSALPGAIVLISGLALSIALVAFARHEMAVADIRLTQTSLLDRGIPRLWQNGKVCRLYREAPAPTVPNG